MEATKPFDRVLAKAAEQHGFIRTEDVRQLRTTPVYLRKLAATGRLENRARGLYRLTAFPLSGNAAYQEAVLWANGRGAIAGEAALALWGLADTNPRLTDVVVPTGYQIRRARGPHVRLRHIHFHEKDVDLVDNIRVLTPERAITDAIAIGVDEALVRQAITNARRRDLVGDLGEARLRVALAERRPTPRGRE